MRQLHLICKSLSCTYPSVCVCLCRLFFYSVLLLRMTLIRLVLLLRMTLITEGGSWEGRALVDSSCFVSSTVRETERVEKNNEDCAKCFPGLGGDAPHFDHTLPIRLFQQATVYKTSNSCQTIRPHYHEIHIKFI